MAENWIRTDESEDVAGSLRHVLRVAPFVGEDPLAWKWVAVALHSALAGACVCHLTTTAPPVGSVTKRNARDWLAYREELRTNPDVKRPHTYLMALPDLLAAARKPSSAGGGSNAAGVEISESELCWLGRFHTDIRNQFVHFEPMGWSIEVSGIPDIAKVVARIIEEILEIGWAFRHMDCAKREEMQRSLRALTLFEWHR
jgi:hypothetical protein